MFDAQPDSAPRILEIGSTPYLYTAFPQTTDFYSTWNDEQVSEPAQGRRIVTLATLPGLVRRLADPAYDLVAVHALPYSSWSLRSLSRTLFRRSVLRGSVPIFRPLGQQLLRGRVSAPVAVLDFDDPTVIDRANTFLIDKATVYFKRELPPDHWQVFNGTLHWRVPTPRFREAPRNRERVAKLAPIALGIEAGAQDQRAASGLPSEKKTIDVFFAGRIHNSATIRERGLKELLALRAEGYAIDVPEEPISREEYFARCERSWIVWSPAGYGWQCFRTWEAALCGSVPLANRPTIEQHRPLVEGVHALYYDVEPDGLTHAIKTALADRARLLTMGSAARAFVLTYHTRAALARHIVETTLQRARAAGSHLSC